MGLDSSGKGSVSVRTAAVGGRNRRGHHAQAAEGFVAQVHDALKAGPQWDRMVFVLNFDEHGGFFDHVPPPACADNTEVEDRI
jgi:phospholipase C